MAFDATACTDCGDTFAAWELDKADRCEDCAHAEAISDDDALPPAYTEWIGRRLIDHMGMEAA